MLLSETQSVPKNEKKTDLTELKMLNNDAPIENETESIAFQLEDDVPSTTTPKHEGIFEKPAPIFDKQQMSDL
jgi:hypothetical protein